MNKLNNEELKDLGNKILKASKDSFNSRFGRKDIITVKDTVGCWVDELIKNKDENTTNK